MRSQKVGAILIWAVVLTFVSITTGFLFQDSLSTAVEDAGESAGLQAVPVAAASSLLANSDSESIPADEYQGNETDDITPPGLPYDPEVSDKRVGIKAPGATEEKESVLLPQGVSTNWWAEALNNIKKQEYEITWQEMPVPENIPAAYQAPNRAHNLRTYFTGEGIRIIPRSEQGPSWQLGLKLKGYGYTASATEFLPAEPVISGNSIEYFRGAVTEWYENSEQGLKQGFILETTSEDNAINTDASIVLNLELTGDLYPRHTAQKEVIELTDSEGTAVLYYGKVQATDASGYELPSSVNLDNKTIAVEIEAEGAAYPITVASTIAGISSTASWTAESNQASAWFGYSVATAGDVNGDAYSDVIVGAPSYDNGQTNEGRAFVYYGSAGGLSATASWTAESNQADAKFGYTVSTAADVNGDGYADVIVGALYYSNPQTSEGRAFVYYGSAGGLSTTAGWTAESDQEYANFGYSVSTAGDVNGDGYADVIVGAPNYASGPKDTGMAFVYYGSAGGLSTTPNWTEDGKAQAGAKFGYSVATAGDVNGDGYADVIVGAPDYGTTKVWVGRAYVYYGSAAGLATTANWIAESDQDKSRFGYSVSTAGDVNGDGYADVIVGAPNYDNGQTDEGRAFVYHGSAGGLIDAPGWTVESDQEYAYFGNSVATAGDVNGDGYADVIVGVPWYTNGQTNEGAAYVYYGSAGGLSATASWTAESNQANAWLGYSVATAGDVNGDGYADVIVGAPYYENGQTYEGRAFVYNGSAGGLSVTPGWTAESDQATTWLGYSVATAGDVNGDGYADVIVGAPNYDNGQTDEGRAFVYHGSAGGLSATPNWTAESNQANAYFGNSVSTAGDVNGDGYADVIVGAPNYDNGQTDEGRAFVYHGSAGGLSATPNWTAESNQPNAYFSNSVSTAGDVNGDGYADVIVGAPNYDNGETDEGRAFVYRGSAAGLSATANWTAESNQASAYFGNSVSTAGDVNGDGYADVIVGAPNYDNGETDEGRAFVYRGSAAGLSATASWTAEGDQEYAYFGNSVVTAGDVNGDGYADVIVGAPNYDNGETDEGRAFVYRGSAAGLSATASWTAESNQASAYFGNSVSTAGDVNGDGYADVIVGAPNYDNGETDEGRAFVYRGSASGLSTTANWTAESNQAVAYFGHSVATTGDVNGDGYADVIVGAPNYDNGETDEGRAYVYYGNDGGVALRPRQMCADGSAPIAHRGMSESTNSFMLALTGKTPFGRGNVTLEYEIKPLGVLFNGQNTNTLSMWHDTGTQGIDISALCSGLSAGTPYHWRCRVRYDQATTPFQQSSRWLTMPWNGWQETKLKTNQYPPAAPSNLDVVGTCTGAVLTWTDNSRNETGFQINRAPSSSGPWDPVATVSANTTTYADSSEAPTNCYIVTAVNEVGTSAGTDIVCADRFFLPTGEPSGLSANAVSSNQINLSWIDNSNNETGFKIERALDNAGTPGTFAEIAAVGAGVTTYQDNTGLSACTSYWYRVRAYNGCGDSSYSSNATATTQSTTISAPSHLSATAVSSSGIDLSWRDNSNNEDGFVIERAPYNAGSPGTFAEIAAVGAGVTTYQDNTGLNPCTSYWYRVRARNACGPTVFYSDYSSNATATTHSLPITAPGSLSATAVSPSEIALSWTDNSNNEDGFEIERAPDNAGNPGTFVKIATLGAGVTTYQDNTGLSACTLYWYRVRARNACGAAIFYSGYSNNATATTQTLPIIAPGSLSATAVSSSRIDLAWTDNSTNETGFKIERADADANGNPLAFVQIATVGAGVTTYRNNTGLSACTTYWYRVRAFNPCIDSSYSNNASATTQSATINAPGSLAAIAVSLSEITLFWTDNSNNEDGFEVERAPDNAGNPGTFVKIATVGAGVTTYQDNDGLSGNTTYWYRLRARNACAVAVFYSAYSNNASATTTSTPTTTTSIIPSTTTSVSTTTTVQPTTTTSVSTTTTVQPTTTTTSVSTTTTVQPTTTTSVSTTTTVQPTTTTTSVSTTTTVQPTTTTSVSTTTTVQPTTTTTSVMPSTTTSVSTTTTIQTTTTTTSVPTTTTSIASTTTTQPSTTTTTSINNIQMLVREYYLDILDREPDQEGWDYWVSEIERINTLGIYLGEGFQAEARFFLNSQEYLSMSKTNTQFVTDLYQTFLQRDPDTAGLNFWVGQLSCLTRNMLITQFAYSDEFKQYMTNLFGPDITRPENNMVNDFYRGFMSRFPDDSGFNSWLVQMRQAQCTGPQAVQELSYQLSLLFIQSAEYAGRNRNNTEYVEDLYNAILRRGADCEGFTAWVNSLDGGMSRVDMLGLFTASTEFQGRVNAVIAAGCLP